MHRRRDSATDFLFTLTLFCVFAVSSLLVVLIGVRVYRNTVESMTQNYSSRTAVAYLQEKLRENDETDAIALETRQGVSVLSLTRTLEGERYTTSIYWMDGALREMFAKQNAEIDLAAGQAIAEIEGLLIEEPQNGVWRITVQAADGDRTLLFYPKSAGGNVS